MIEPRQSTRMVVTETTPNTWLVHQADRMPVSGVAVHYYDRQDVVACDCGYRSTQIALKPCRHVELVKQRGRFRRRTDRCLRCGGHVYQEHKGETACANCGHRVYT